MTAGDCTHWSAMLTCSGTGMCVAAGTPFNCVASSTFHYGTIATGRCCTPGFDVASQCAGGLCESTGLDTNPYYCTQGCLTGTDCPGGYVCELNFCWIAQSFTDPNYAYTCN
jgi:hypothetical protein